MGSIINTIRLLLGIIPALIELIKAIELPGNGADKAAAIIAIIKAAFEVIPGELKEIIGLDHVEAFVRKVIDIVVGFLNKVGVFKNS